MKCRFAIAFILIICISMDSVAGTVPANVNDSLALVDLYNSTNGPGWIKNKNWLTGPVSTWFGVKTTNERVTSIGLNFNGLTGTIPSSIESLTALTFLDLSNNAISGAIPSAIGNLTNLKTLLLFNDELTGSIPFSIGKLVNIITLNVSQNQLTGAIPASIGNCISLENLVLYYNQLSGTIPPSIGNLVNLTGLDLFVNELSGSIPDTIGNLQKLVYLQVYSNKLSGSIPSSIGKLRKLKSLDLRNNKLTGSLPAAISNLTNLTSLYLSTNKLSGHLPPGLGKLHHLNYAYFDNNFFTGEIPPAYNNLSGIFVINVNYNLLSQQQNIPVSGPKQLFTEIYLTNNRFNFNGLEWAEKKFGGAYYSPQAPLTIYKINNVLSVDAGGTISNNTYYWYRAGSGDSTIVKGDSIFIPTLSGKYYARITNAIATKLTLTTDTIIYTAPLIAANSNGLAVSANAIAQGSSRNNTLLVYPNPAKDIIAVQTKGSAVITITDVSGKIMLTKSVNGNAQINVNALAAGVYYLQNKTTGEVKKIMIAH